MTLNLATATIEEVAEYVAQEGPPYGPETKSRRSARRRGVRILLGKIADQPGDTWATRWYAAGDSIDLYFRDQFDYSTPDDPQLSQDARKTLCPAFGTLLRLKVLRPGLHLLLNRGASAPLYRQTIAEHQTEISKALAAATESQTMTTDAARRFKYACAAMIVFTGKPLSRITVDEWVTAEQFRVDATRRYDEWRAARQAAATTGEPEPPQPATASPQRKLTTLRSAYSACVLAGLTQPRAAAPGLNPLPPTLGRATAPPATLDTLLATKGRRIPPRVRSLLRDTYAIDGHGLDYVTIAAHLNDVSNLFTAVHALIPGHDSLTIPLEHRDDILRTLRRTRNGGKGGTTRERKGLSTMLGRLQTVYKMTNSVVRRHELTQHLDVLGTFPWTRAVLQSIGRKQRAISRTEIHRKVRLHLNHLDGLVNAARDLSESDDRILEAARNTPTGGCFTVDGQKYKRASRPADSHIGDGAPQLFIRKAKEGDPDRWQRFFDIEARAYRSAQCRHFTVFIRETGGRIEELAELAVDDIASIPAGTLNVPAICINPSKLDRGRIIALTPAALTALHAMVQRTRERYGRDPEVQRKDWHEQTDQEARRLVFIAFGYSRVFTGPGREYFAQLLNFVVDHYNKNLNTGPAITPVTPHQMRRLFATDLGERGADPVTIQTLLGHATLATTGIYLHMDEADALAEIIQLRRQAKQGTANQCPCCAGLGYNPTHHTHPERPTTAVENTDDTGGEPPSP